MTILGRISRMIRTAINNVKSLRKITHEISQLSITEQIELKRIEYEQWQLEYNELQKRTPREKFEKFDTMVNDLIDEYDYDYISATEELRYMLETDEIDLDEDYIEFLRDHDTP